MISSRLLPVLLPLLTTSTGFAQSLLIDFNSATQAPGPPPPQPGYQSYNASHEVAASFTTQSFAAFGTVVELTPSWPNSTDSRVRQMIDRASGNDANWDNGNGSLDLVTDWLGTDTRSSNGGNGNWDGEAAGIPTYLTLTIANLPAGNYSWTSFHHDTENIHGFFQVELSSDGGNNFILLGQDFYMSDSSPGGNPDSAIDGGGGVQAGPDVKALSSTANFLLESNGVDEVVLRFAPLSGVLGNAVHNQFFLINGFEIVGQDDADNDGLPDSYEQQIIDADPGDALSSIEDVLPDDDYDGDGSSNENELARKTDPTDDDSDDDSLLDGAETNTGTFVSASDTGTDPNSMDSDGDTIKDSDEISGTGGFPSDPNKADTDGDGYPDDAELADGTDPNDSDDFPAPLTDLEGLFVDFNSTNQDGGPHNQDGYLAYDAGHEVGGDFVTRSYDAFGTTVTLTPAWPNTTDDRVQQSIDRGSANDANWSNAGNDLDLVTDWIGADTRPGNGGNGDWDGGAVGTPTYLTLTLGDLPAGDYQWISFHHDTEHVHGYFQIEISTDGGTTFESLGQDFYMSDSTPGGSPNSDDPGNGFPGPQTGPDATDLLSTAMVEFTARGEDVVLRFAALSNTAVHRQLVAVNGFQLFRTGGGRKPQLELTHRPASNELEIRWDSQAGMLYNLRSEIAPSSGLPRSWPLYGNFENIEATPPRNSLTFPLPPESERFFVVEEFLPPPVTVFSDDFESAVGNWETGSEEDDGTLWELGTPNHVFGPLSAHGGVNCWGTNLTSDYASNAVAFLKSPPIDLTSAEAQATLKFFQFVEIENPADKGQIRILDAADDSLIEILQDDINGLGVDWQESTLQFPTTALGKVIKIEFRFQSDAVGEFAGWYLDDLEVTVP